MAEFTGKAMTLTIDEGSGAKALVGITKVTINETGKGKIAQLDITDNNYTVYTELPDPLGAKGTAKATFTVEFQDSAVGYAQTDPQATELLAAGGAIAFAGGITTNDVTWAHAAMQLTKRTTRITWDLPVAHGTLVYEANSVGTWGNVS